MTEPHRSQDSLAAAISQELAVCRKRGIERLDLKSHNQDPVQTPELQSLVDAYIRVTQHRVRGRIAGLKYLLRDAIGAFATENAVDARLVNALFFGDSQDRVTKSAGELLDIARRQSGFDNEVRFRQVRREAFEGFADFLVRFVADTSANQELVNPDDGQSSVLSQDLSSLPVPEPEVQRHVATTGYIDTGEHFIDLLSQAANVTIVGFTNEKLASMLRIALERKRAAMLRPDGFWESIRIVFLNHELLSLIKDEREYPDREEGLLLRRRAAVYGRRTVRVFLRIQPSGRWEMYESPYFPPLFGTLFEMPDGHRIVQLVIRRPQRNASDHLYLEIEDTRGHYFSAAFEEIVHSSTDDNKVVPVGIVTPQQRFRLTSTRYRRSILTDGSKATGWIPLVLVITWRLRDGRAEPVLQLRTQLNAARELGRFSHLAGHISEDRTELLQPEFGLTDDVPMTAALRRLQVETGEVDQPSGLEPVWGCDYLHPDKEHLFFFIYSCQLPDGFLFWRQAEMFPLSVQELLSLRANQTLHKSLALCQSPPASRKERAAAFEISILNLHLHGYETIARKMTSAAGQRTAALREITTELRGLEEQTRQTWAAFEGETEVKGLSGLHYREFFTILLPFYRSVGVPGAAEALKLVNDDDTKRSAVERLSVLYHDEQLMGAISLEL